MKTAEDIASEFNEFSKNYTHDMNCCVPHYARLLASFSDHIPPARPINSVLDLGCGNGNVTAEVVKLFPEAKFTLVDASEEMLELCAQRFAKRDCQYVNSYFSDFKFEESAFDLVVAGFSLHHCEAQEKEEIFQKVYESLKPGGIFASADLMIDKSNPDHPELIQGWKSLVDSHFPDGEKWKWIMEHYDAFDRPTNYKTQVNWLKDIGFTQVEVKFRIGHWAYWQAAK